MYPPLAFKQTGCASGAVHCTQQSAKPRRASFTYSRAHSWTVDAARLRRVSSRADRRYRRAVTVSPASNAQVARVSAASCFAARAIASAVRTTLPNRNAARYSNDPTCHNFKLSRLPDSISVFHRRSSIRRRQSRCRLRTRGAMRFRDCRHIGDRSRRCAKADTAEPGRDDGRVVSHSHRWKNGEHHVENGDGSLQCKHRDQKMARGLPTSKVACSSKTWPKICSAIDRKQARAHACGRASAFEEKRRGTVLVRAIAVSRQATNRGSFRPACTSTSCREKPIRIATLRSSIVLSNWM